MLKLWILAVAAALPWLTAHGMRSGCFGFPDENFTPHNHVSICSPDSNKGCKDRGLGMKTGDAATDFLLVDRDSGKTVSLFDDLLRRGKPVFIELGSYT